MSAEKTSWQKLSAVFRDAQKKPQEYNSDTIALSLVSVLADAIEKGEPVCAAVTEAKQIDNGAAEVTFKVMKMNGSSYYVVFPDRAAAEVMRMNTIELPTDRLVRILLDSERIDGIQVILDADAKTHSFFPGEISKKTAASILEAAGRSEKVK